MSFYEKGAARIYYEEAGSGFPLLIIPGGGLNAIVAGLSSTSPFNPIDNDPWGGVREIQPTTARSKKKVH